MNFQLPVLALPHPSCSTKAKPKKIGACLAVSGVLWLAGCVNDNSPSNLDGFRLGRTTVVKTTKGELGDLPSALADTMRVCWSEKDELFEGFKVGAIRIVDKGSKQITLNGPLAGDPPQRFNILLTNNDDKSGYRIEMEYPVGSNYAFVRSRLAKDVRTLQSGKQPCG